MAWVVPRTWVAGETLTAALLNAELRDNLNAAEPVGELHYYIRSATTIATLINGFALETNGVAVSRTTYAALNTLLNALGYPFGSGDGSTTMTLPDVQGRGLVAMASGGHADVNTLGDSDGGVKTARTPKVAAHTHIGDAHTHGDGSLAVTLASVTAAAGGDHSVAVAGSYSVTGTTASDGAEATTSNGGGNGAFLTAGVYAVKAF